MSGSCQAEENRAKDNQGPEQDRNNKDSDNRKNRSKSAKLLTVGASWQYRRRERFGRGVTVLGSGREGEGCCGRGWPRSGGLQGDILHGRKIATLYLNPM